MTTKEQERKALEKIRKIVADLGEDSYVATAFEGCFEIAEENIENDWACSMKQRMESAESKAFEARNEVDNLRVTVSKLKMMNEMLKCVSLPSKDAAALRHSIGEQKRDYTCKLEDANKSILENCQNAGSAEFNKAVNSRGIYMDSIQRIDQIDAVLRDIIDGWTHIDRV